MAYLFDDVHIEFGDLARVRDAAARHLATELQHTDRAAIYTTSGRNMLEFTDDRERLHEALFRLRPRAMSQIQECTDVDYYTGDLILNRGDSKALQDATYQAMACAAAKGVPITAREAESTVRSAAMRAVFVGEQETREALSILKDVVRRMSAMPGQRTVLLASPGFLTPAAHQDVTDLLDRAIRARVIINSLDARGLYTDPTFDPSRPTFDIEAEGIMRQYERAAATRQSDVLAELSAGTGGTFFQNNNDLSEAFRRLASAPEYFYLLGFSPQNLKMDGSYHNLKVALQPPAGLTASARRGYYAPKQLENAAETAHREIEEALFSRDEMSDIPADLRTQFFKSAKDDATLAVLAHVDLKHVPLRKADGRNCNTLTVVSVVFDRNGNVVSGNTKTIELRLRDQTLAKLLGPGISIKTNFAVKPGAYAVRLVVRDAEGQLMSAQNGAVEIP